MSTSYIALHDTLNQPTITQNSIQVNPDDKNSLMHQLETAEHWLQKYGDDSALLTALAYLNLKTQFPGKAFDFAKKALAKTNCFEDLVVLGDVFNQLGKTDCAIQSLTQAVAIKSA